MKREDQERLVAGALRDPGNGAKVLELIAESHLMRVLLADIHKELKPLMAGLPQPLLARGKGARLQSMLEAAEALLHEEQIAEVKLEVKAQGDGFVLLNHDHEVARKPTPERPKKAEEPEVTFHGPVTWRKFWETLAQHKVDVCDCGGEGCGVSAAADCGHCGGRLSLRVYSNHPTLTLRCTKCGRVGWEFRLDPGAEEDSLKN